MNKKSLRGSIYLLLAAIIWGSAAVAQSMGMDHVGPFTFNGLRTLIGALVLLPVILIRDRASKRRGEVMHLTPEEKKAASRLQLKAGILTGIAMFIPSTMQQIALITTDAGKTGFITALYIVVVPLMGIFLGKRTNLFTWLSVIIAVVGMYFLCVTTQLTIASGDILLLVSTIFWGIQILVIDHFAPHVDCLKLSCAEFLVTGLLSLPPMFILEQPNIESIMGCLLPMLYAGALSCGVAYTLQTVGQKYTHPTVASIIMSLESVFAVIAGFIVLSERLTQREAVGCVLMFIAVIISQVAPAPASRKAKESGVADAEAGNSI